MPSGTEARIIRRRRVPVLIFSESLKMPISGSVTASQMTANSEMVPATAALTPAMVVIK